MVSNQIKFDFQNKNYDFRKIEIHIKANATNDLKFAILIDKLSVPPVFIKENIINKLYIDGEAIKYKNFDINNYYSWLSKEGGIHIKNFKLGFKETNINGNAFVGLDKKFNIQNSLSLHSNNLSSVFSLLEKNNFIPKNTLNKVNLIINAVEIASEASNKKANFSINIQNGYLYLMGIKLIKIPDLKVFL